MLTIDYVSGLFETISTFVMVIALYYGIALKRKIPSELAALNLIVYALFFMLIRRISHVIVFVADISYMHIANAMASIIIATLMLIAFNRMYTNLTK